MPTRPTPSDPVHWWTVAVATSLGTNPPHLDLLPQADSAASAWIWKNVIIVPASLSDALWCGSWCRCLSRATNWQPWTTSSRSARTANFWQRMEHLLMFHSADLGAASTLLFAFRAFLNLPDEPAGRNVEHFFTSRGCLRRSSSSWRSTGAGRWSPQRRALAIHGMELLSWPGAATPKPAGAIGQIVQGDLMTCI
ncbi:hypothetical protein GGX14DRAFT_398887 [Mycena pura]|uniref:Uncharacterized protein n=1 Tax=Mycena pura TaxID=153505 RepID=A0AAD6YB26_9AGAR|nr:hypothetical protein GGX14DRAFT_398887 [Mycena pura]